MKSELIKYFQDRPEIIAVYLFGSYARGRERLKSDVDLGILLDHGSIARAGEISRAYNIELSRVLRKDLHILVMNNAGEEIISQIFKYGACVLNRKPDELSRFKMVKYAMIAEFSHYRNLMEQAFLNRLSGDSR